MCLGNRKLAFGSITKGDEAKTTVTQDCDVALTVNARLG